MKEESKPAPEGEGCSKKFVTSFCDPVQTPSQKWINRARLRWGFGVVGSMAYRKIPSIGRRRKMKFFTIGTPHFDGSLTGFGCNSIGQFFLLKVSTTTGILRAISIPLLVCVYRVKAAAVPRSFDCLALLVGVSLSIGEPAVPLNQYPRLLARAFSASKNNSDPSHRNLSSNFLLGDVDGLTR
jgi:hypothetical protein